MTVKGHPWLITILTGLLVTVVYAWFSLVNVYPVEITTGAFSAEIDIMVDDVIVTTSSPWFDQSTGLILLDGSDEMAPNYIGTIKVVIRITAHNTARFRIRLMDEWLLTRTYSDYQETVRIIPGLTFVGENTVYPYDMNPLFFMRDDDVYYYYDGLLLPGETLEIIVLDGANGYQTITSPFFVDDVRVTFSVAVDIVQANRIHEVWGVEPTLFDEEVSP